MIKVKLVFVDYIILLDIYYCCNIIYLMVFMAEIEKGPKLGQVKLVSNNYGACDIDWVAALIKMNYMNCVMFKLKFKVLLNPWKIIFGCCIFYWTELDSNYASMFSLRIVRASVRQVWYFWEKWIFYVDYRAWLCLKYRGDSVKIILKIIKRFWNRNELVLPKLCILCSLIV